MIIHERKKYFDESGITEVDPQSHERYTVALEVEYIFEPEDYLEALEAKCKELRKRANFPGFRPGTAPMHLIKARLGKEVLRELLIEALNQELGSLYYGSRYLALTQPIVFEQPDFKILEGNHTFKAWMNICEDRELILPNREPIEIRAPVDPTEAVIERELRLMAASNGTTETVDPAQAPEAGFEYFIEAAFNPLDNFKNLPQSGQKFQPANPDDASTSQKNRHPLEAFVQALADLDIPIVKQLAEKSPEPDAPLDETLKKQIRYDFLSDLIFEKKHTYFSVLHPTFVRRMMELPPYEWHAVKLSELFPEGPERDLFIRTRIQSRKLFEYLDGLDMAAIRYDAKRVAPAPIDERLVNKRLKLSRLVTVDEYREILKTLYMSEIELDMQEYLHDAVYDLLMRHNPVRINRWMAVETLKRLMRLEPQNYPAPANEHEWQKMIQEQMRRAHRDVVVRRFIAMQQQDWNIPDRVARVPILLGLMKSTLKGKNDLREVDKSLRAMGYPSFDEPTEQEIDEALIFTEGFRRLRAIFNPEEWAYLNIVTDRLWEKDENNVRALHYVLCTDNYICRRAIETKIIELKYVYPEQPEYHKYEFESIWERDS